MIIALAGIIALPLGGYLITVIGARNVILISAGLGFVSIVCYLLIKEKQKKIR